MAIHNYAGLEGRLVAEPELRYTTGENARANLNFTVAVNRDFKNPEGGYDADFIRCVAFGPRAEFISKYFHKGDPIIVQGSIRTGNYTNKEGIKVYTTDIAVDNVGFTVSSRGSSGEATAQDVRATKPDTSFMNIPNNVGDHEELPF